MWWIISLKQVYPKCFKNNRFLLKIILVKSAVSYNRVFNWSRFSQVTHLKSMGKKQSVIVGHFDVVHFTIVVHTDLVVPL